MTGPARCLRLKRRCTDPTPPIARSRSSPPSSDGFRRRPGPSSLATSRKHLNSHVSCTPPVAQVERVELAGKQVVVGGGSCVLVPTINYFWALPRIPKDPPGDSDASRDSAVALSVGKASLSGLSSKMHGVPDSSQFSSVQFSQSVQSVGLGRPLGASPDTPIPMEP